jgi:hypothetical protein
MNSFKIKSIDREAAIVEYTVDKSVFTEKYDARYLPVDDAEALEAYFQNQLAGYIKDATVVALPAEVVALVNAKVDYVEPLAEVAVTK